MCLTWGRNWVETKIPEKCVVEVEKLSVRGHEKSLPPIVCLQPSSGMRTGPCSARAGGVDIPVVLEQGWGGCGSG